MCHNPRTPYLVLSLIDNRYMLMKADCKTYGCPECGKRRQRDHFIRLLVGAKKLKEQGERVCFVTLTSHRKLRTYAATKAVFPKAWGKLSKRWKREQDGKLEYAMVFENHKDGRLHCHMLVTCTVTKKWLKDNCAKVGLGYMVDIQELTDDNLSKKASYVAKYATKKIGGNTGKNITFSRDFPEPDEMDTSAIVEIWRYETPDLAMSAVSGLHVDQIVLRDGVIIQLVDFMDEYWYA